MGFTLTREKVSGILFAYQSTGSCIELALNQAMLYFSVLSEKLLENYRYNLDLQIVYLTNISTLSLICLQDTFTIQQSAFTRKYSLLLHLTH